MTGFTAFSFSLDFSELAEVLEQPASATPASATAPVAAAPMKPRRDIWSDIVFPFLGLPVPRRQLLIGTSERKARSSAKG